MSTAGRVWNWKMWERVPRTHNQGKLHTNFEGIFHCKDLEDKAMVSPSTLTGSPHLMSSWKRTGTAQIQSKAINLGDQKLSCSEYSSEVRLFLSPRGKGSKSVILPADNPVTSRPSSPSQIPQLPPRPLALSSMESFRELAENKQST